MFAAADQIMGWSGWRGSLQSLCVCAGSFSFFFSGEGYRGVTAGSGGGSRGGVGSYDLKEPFL